MIKDAHIQTLVANRCKRFAEIVNLREEANRLRSKAKMVEAKAEVLDKSFTSKTSAEQLAIEAEIREIYEESDRYKDGANKLSMEAYRIGGEVFSAVEKAAIELYGSGVSIECHGAAAMTLNGIRYTA